jgi:hypothetical protein
MNKGIEGEVRLNRDAQTAVVSKKPGSGHERKH